MRPDASSVRVQVDRQERIEVAPVVGDLPAGHALAVHRQVEAAAARAVGVIEREAGFIEPDLQHAGLEADLQAAACEDQSPLFRTGHCCRLIQLESVLVA